VGNCFSDVQQVCERLPTRRKISYATCRTALSGWREAISNTGPEGKAHVFYPASIRHVINGPSRFPRTLFAATDSSMQHLAEHRPIDADDIETTQKLIEG